MSEDLPPTEPFHAQTALPERIRNYHILEKIGEGGMGEVFLAEQEQPRRAVAIKVIKWGMDTRRVLARFEAERQALALMDHPSIARVYDAGSTERGRPYFAMEYVKGVPITEHCDRQRSTTRERLELFSQICDGVQHAHHKAVIHRDIKPSNVLVTIHGEQALPKIIDFGVAKATGSRLTDKTLHTELGQLIGTREYMSPEQAELTGQDVDTRTDVYSLGVLLYELLVGVLPFDSKQLRDATFDEVRRTIREQEPARPSTRITFPGAVSTESARKRRTDPAALRRQLSGDLDWITMKALEKDRTRRYGSAAELAADIRRHLQHEPVLASPPSRAYRIGKFVRRHRVGVGAAALVLAAVLTGVAGLGVGLLRARQEAARANLEAETSRQVSAFLEGLFEISDPEKALGNTITAREILDRGAERIARDLGDQPLVQARLMATMGRVYESLGFYEQARPLLEKSLAVREQTLGEGLEVADGLSDLAGLMWQVGEYDLARTLHERALAIREARLAPGDPQIAENLDGLGNLLARQGRYPEARTLLQRALDMREAALGPLTPEVADTLSGLGAVYFYLHEYERAQELWERALAHWEQSLPADHPNLARALNNLGVVRREIGDAAGARPLLERALAILEKVLGPDHPQVAKGLHNLANLNRDLGDYDAARALYERALGIQEQTIGVDHPDYAETLASLGQFHFQIEDYEEAIRLGYRALAMREKLLPPDDPQIARSLGGIGLALERSGNFREAGTLYARALEINEKVLPANDVDLAWSLNNTAYTTALAGDRERAGPLYERALAIFEEIQGPDGPAVAWVLTNIGELATQMQDYAAARRALERALQIYEKAAKPDSNRLAKVLWELARVELYENGRSAASPKFERALGVIADAYGEDAPWFVYSQACLQCLLGDRDGALRGLRRAAEMGLVHPQIMADQDLDPLHGDPEFERIVARVTSKRDQPR